MTNLRLSTKQVQKVILASLLCLSIIISVASCNTAKYVDGNAYVSFDISPDGRTIVFAGIGDGGKDLYLLDLATRKVTRLADTPVYENYPAFSPDGKSIVYEGAVSLDKPRYLFLRSLDGRYVKQITFGTKTEDTCPSFSNDGKYLVFCRAKTYYPQYKGEDTWDHCDVYTIDVNGNHLKPITHGNYHGAIAPKFSPDGKYILFEHSVEFPDYDIESHIAKIDSRGKGPLHVIVPFQHDSGCARFLPNGKQIVFNSGDGNGYVDLYIRNLNGGQPRPLHTYVNDSGGGAPAVDRNGEWVYYLQGGGNLWRVKVDGSYKEMIADKTLFSDPTHWIRTRLPIVPPKGT